MSDKDINKVHELAEHEDLKTFHYMLQGKENGRIKLGSVADNADLVGDTPEKKREKEFQDLLITTAGMAALEEADRAISGMGEHLRVLSENVQRLQQYADRADYLKDQLYIISALLDHGSEEEKLLYLLEQGYSQEEIDVIKTDGTVGDHLTSLGRDMAIEAEDLRALIESEAEAYTRNQEHYQTERTNAQEALEKATAEGNEEEVQHRRDQIKTLDEEFAAFEEQVGETLLNYKDIYSDDLDTVIGEFVGSSQEYREYEDLAQDHMDSAIRKGNAGSISLGEDFNKAVNQEENGFTMQDEIAQPQVNVSGLDF